MKILHLTRHLEMGGIPRYILELSSRLSQKGHEIIVASTGGSLVASLERIGVRHLHVPLSSKFAYGLHLWQSWKVLQPVLRESSFDIVHAHTRSSQVLAEVLRRFHGVRTVTTCHGFFKTNLGRRWWPCWGQRVIAISKPVRDNLIHTHGIDPRKIVLIPNGVDTQRFGASFETQALCSLRKRFNIPAWAKIMGTTARLSPVKGLEYLLEGFSLSLREHPELYCLIVGEGPIRKDLEGIARDLGVAERVVFTGGVDEVAPFLNLMDVFVMPSLQEGLGISLLEAFASGRSVVASRVGGIVDILHNEENGLSVSPRSAEEISWAVHRLLSNVTLAENLRKAARATVERHFSLERMVTETEAVYESV